MVMVGAEVMVCVSDVEAKAHVLDVVAPVLLLVGAVVPVIQPSSYMQACCSKHGHVSCIVAHDTCVRNICHGHGNDHDVCDVCDAYNVRVPYPCVVRPQY